jgi:HD-GYP domain-containing protein (c-di-GMP phosphodiesterase class II)
VTNTCTLVLDPVRSRKADRLSAALNELVDVDLLLMRMLGNARNLLNCEAGSIYLLRGDKLILASSQNDYLERIVGGSSLLPFLNYIMKLDRSSIAGYVAIEQKPLVINNTHDIDPDEPYEHFTVIDHKNDYYCQAMMTVPIRCRDGHNFGVIQVINPLDHRGQVKPFEEQDESVLCYYMEWAALALERAMELRSMTIRSAEVVAVHDPRETPAHVQRVACLSLELYEYWATRNNVPYMERLRVTNLLPLAAMLHDIGKMRVPEYILTKPGRLDLKERAVMEDHVLIGARLFQSQRTALDALTFQVILDHHERWDGQGYPGWVDLDTKEPLPGHVDGGGKAKGKKGEEISIYGRILAVADVFDALVSRKSYKDPFDEALSLQIMEQESGHHFDPEVVEALMARRPVLKKILERFPDTRAASDIAADLPLSRAPVAYPAYF